MHARGGTLYDINVCVCVCTYERHSNLLPSEKIGRRKLYIYTHTRPRARVRATTRGTGYIYIYKNIYTDDIVFSDLYK